MRFTCTALHVYSFSPLYGTHFHCLSPSPVHSYASLPQLHLPIPAASLYPSLLLLLPAGTHRYTWDPHNGGEARRLPDGEEFDAGGEVRGKEALVGW